MYLEMDAATRHRANYFAINARFVDDDGTNLTRTLAVKDTKAQHDSTYLKHVIGVLEEYHIQKQQIVSIVTDNASNMIKTIEKLNEDEDSNPMEKIESDVAEQENERRDATLDDVTEEASKLCVIRHMHCAVHTLQLAIRDGLKDTHSKN